MLEYDLYTPENVSAGARLIVLLHGRGADKDDMLGLAPHLDGALVVAPRASFDAAPWGYGPGWAWYRFLGRNRPEVDSFTESQRALGAFLNELPDQLPVSFGEVVVGGFSQGGTMALAFALRQPGTVHGVINFSGFLADHPEVEATSETAASLRLFWGHGIHDPNIPFELAVEGRRILSQAGADITARDYPAGHNITREELEDVRGWLRRGTNSFES